MALRFKTILMVMSIALILMAETVHAIGLGESGLCTARNTVEAYCVNNGGCPKDGNCYFPDGSYCNLWSFYSGTCPGRGYYEQAIWMSEAYRFLYGDTYSPYTPDSYQYANNLYWPNYNWPTYPSVYGPYL